MDDKALAQSVYSVIQETLLKRSNQTDINYLAARMLALNIFDDAWKEMEYIATQRTEDKEKLAQIGL